ncbi:MAG TPA: DUF3617 family protein [Rhizomicrobium sp.]
MRPLLSVKGVVAVLILLGSASGSSSMASVVPTMQQAPVSGTADQAPHRRSGLWEQRLTLDDGSYAIPVSKMCIDGATEPRLALAGAQMDRAECQTYRLDKRENGDWSFDSICKLNGAVKVTTSGIARGDFQTSYRVEVVGRTSGATDPKQNATHKLSIDAKWLGACPSGMVGGDYTSGGRITNVFRSDSR